MSLARPNPTVGPARMNVADRWAELDHACYLRRWVGAVCDE